MSLVAERNSVCMSPSKHFRHERAVRIEHVVRKRPAVREPETRVELPRRPEHGHRTGFEAEPLVRAISCLLDDPHEDRARHAFAVVSANGAHGLYFPML